MARRTGISAWWRIGEWGGGERTLSLFPEDLEIPADALDGVQVKIQEIGFRRPRRFGSYWLGCELWRQLGRGEVGWAKVLELLVVSRLVAPGSEFRLHRQGFDQSARGHLLCTGFAVAEKDRLYLCLDRLLPHKTKLERHTTGCYGELFQEEFEVLLYDLTSPVLRNGGAGREETYAAVGLLARPPTGREANGDRADRERRRLPLEL